MSKARLDRAGRRCRPGPVRPRTPLSMARLSGAPAAPIHVAMFLAKVAQGEVTPIQYGLLSILVDRPNIDQFTIGEELGLDPANVTDILKRLESRKLVSRIVDPDNRRRKLSGHDARCGIRQKIRPGHARLAERVAGAAGAGQSGGCSWTCCSRLVEANNDSGRTSLRPGGRALYGRQQGAPGTEGSGQRRDRSGQTSHHPKTPDPAPIVGVVGSACTPAQPLPAGDSGPTVRTPIVHFVTTDSPPAESTHGRPFPRFLRRQFKTGSSSLLWRPPTPK